MPIGYFSMLETPPAESGPGSVLQFVKTVESAPADGCVVVLDTTWTAGRSGAEPPRVRSVRDLAERILSKVDLIAETSGLLDAWAAGSGAIDRLTIRGTSFWYYVRLR